MHYCECVAQLFLLEQDLSKVEDNTSFGIYGSEDRLNVADKSNHALLWHIQRDQDPSKPIIRHWHGGCETRPIMLECEPSHRESAHHDQNR